MEHLKTYESHNEQTFVLKSRSNREITVVVKNGRYATIDNPHHLRFPFRVGEPYNRSLETFCSNNDYAMNGKDVGSEPKVFGIRQRDIPKGHELRHIFPHKFRK